MNANRKSKIENLKLLWLIRHGESTANVARHKAERDNLPTIDFPEREADTTLSATGEKQSKKIGNWFAKDEILAIDRACDIENCAVTKYKFEGGRAILETDNIFPPVN